MLDIYTYTSRDAFWYARNQYVCTGTYRKYTFICLHLHLQAGKIGNVLHVATYERMYVHGLGSFSWFLRDAMHPHSSSVCVYVCVCVCVCECVCMCIISSGRHAPPCVCVCVCVCVCCIISSWRQVSQQAIRVGMHVCISSWRHVRRQTICVCVSWTYISMHIHDMHGNTCLVVLIMRVCAQVYMGTCVSLCITYACMQFWWQTNRHIYTHKRTYTRICIYIHTHIYIYMHILKSNTHKTQSHTHAHTKHNHTHTLLSHKNKSNNYYPHLLLHTSDFTTGFGVCSFTWGRWQLYLFLSHDAT